MLKLFESDIIGKEYRRKRRFLRRGVGRIHGLARA